MSEANSRAAQASLPQIEYRQVATAAAV